jgi:hypothetical protein
VSHFEVYVRPMGGVQLAGATCSDDLVHFFAVDPEKKEEIPELPVCGNPVQAARTLSDSDPMCETCMAAGMSWAQGGTLKVSKDTG